MSAVGMVSRFSPPGNVDDLTDAQKDAWSDWISGQVEEAREGREWEGTLTEAYHWTNNAPRPQLFNPLTTAKVGDYAEKVISWTAFPRNVEIKAPTEKIGWQIADSNRNNQDEYCEWSSEKNDAGKITRVTFTCEGPEYWEFLAEVNPEKVVQLYQKYVNPNVRRGDLFNGNRYNRRNKWNRDTKNGAMHLISPPNSLGAEIELAGGASMVRERGGVILDSAQDLIKCGQYGGPERHSDPTIGAKVNELTRAGGMVSLKNPIGLYFDEFIPVGFTTPDGSDAKDFWKFVRGGDDTPVRAVFEVPAEKGYTVSDIIIGNNPIEYASQITKFVRIKLTGIAQNFEAGNVVKFGCAALSGPFDLSPSGGQPPAVGAPIPGSMPSSFGAPVPGSRPDSSKLKARVTRLNPTN